MFFNHKSRQIVFAIATKKKDMTQEELDAALENIFIAATGVAGLFG